MDEVERGQLEEKFWKLYDDPKNFQQSLDFGPGSVTLEGGEEVSNLSRERIIAGDYRKLPNSVLAGICNDLETCLGEISAVGGLV